MGHEIAVYLIAIMIVFGMGFIVNSMIKMDDKTKKKINSLNRRVHELEVPTKMPKNVQGQGLPSNLFGEIDIKHPVTGEKLRASAHFRVKKNR